MTQMTPELREAVMSLSPHGRLQLVSELWDSLEADDDTPLSDAWKEELDRRQARLDAHPDSLLTWDEVVERVRASAHRS